MNEEYKVICEHISKGIYHDEDDGGYEITTREPIETIFKGTRVQCVNYINERLKGVLDYITKDKYEMDPIIAIDYNPKSYATTSVRSWEIYPDIEHIDSFVYSIEFNK